MSDYHIIIKIKHFDNALLFFKEELLLDINREVSILDKFYRITHNSSDNYYLFYAHITNFSFCIDEFLSKIQSNSSFIYKIFNIDDYEFSKKLSRSYGTITNASKTDIEMFGLEYELNILPIFKYDKSKTLLNWILEQQSNA